VERGDRGFTARGRGNTGRRRYPKGYGGFGEEPCGDGCGVQGEGRGRVVLCFSLGDTVILFDGNYAPALIPLVQP
jgi:hypothetical protein